MPLFWRQEATANASALALFKKASDLDPGYALAHGMQAWCLYQSTSYFWSDDPKAVRAQSIEAANRAISRLGDDASAMVAASVGLMYSGEGPNAAAELIERALSIDPNNAWGWMRHGWLRITLGDSDAATAAFDTATALSPADPFMYNILMGRSVVAARDGDYERAVRLRESALRSAPHLTWPLLALSAFYVLSGDLDKARATMTTFREAHPDMSFAVLAERYPLQTMREFGRLLERAVEAGLPRE